MKTRMYRFNDTFPLAQSALPKAITLKIQLPHIVYTEKHPSICRVNYCMAWNYATTNMNNFSHYDYCCCYSHSLSLFLSCWFIRPAELDNCFRVAYKLERMKDTR